MVVRASLNGQLRWVLSSAHAAPPLPDGTVIWNGFYQDITERKQAEDELKESEAYNKMLFQESHRPIVVYDPATNGFIDCNPAAVKMYGFSSREDVLGKTPIDVSAPTQYDGTDSLTASQRQDHFALTRGAEVFEWRHQRPDGEDLGRDSPFDVVQLSRPQIAAVHARRHHRTQAQRGGTARERGALPPAVRRFGRRHAADRRWPFRGMQCGGRRHVAHGIARRTA